MSTVVLQSCVLRGIDVAPVTVEVDVLQRLPRVVIVGLQASVAMETAERVRSAIVACGFEFPRQRVVVNLAPADLRKDGAGLDLPIALGILAATGQYKVPADGVFLGELGLDGTIKTCRAMYAARIAYGPDLYGSEYKTLRDLVDSIPMTSAHQFSTLGASLPLSPVDYRDVRGSQDAIPGLIEAARTGRPLILVGAPGCGKSMIARRFVGLLPDLTMNEGVELGKIYAAAGFDVTEPMPRPFRAPHHTISVLGLMGDRRMRPGEATLAHNGILFLDDADEFPRAALEMLRMPMETGAVTLTREDGSVTMPAKFRLVLAVNDEERLARVLRYLPSLKDAVVVKLDQPLDPKGAPWPSTEMLRDRVEA